ncbi:MAG: hypothetical protein VB051_09210 [Candidatus Pelethousia sp.]|nr:hypothetical protein [Candidatus Pelethousia sp.]
MSIEPVEHTGFTSGEAQGRLRTPRYIGGAISDSARRGARRLRHRAYVAPRAGSMLVKAGLCAAACAAVLLLRWNESTGGAVLPISGLRQALEDAVLDGAGDGLGLDEGLGRLRFVELPGIIEVFSANAQPELGVSYESARLDDESLLATLTLGGAQQICAPAACKVKELGEDEALGSYVRLALQETDSELVYYGLTEIAVEEGQQLAAKDTLAQAEGSLVLAVYDAGRPTDPIAYFGLDAGRV